MTRRKKTSFIKSALILVGAVLVGALFKGKILEQWRKLPLVGDLPDKVGEDAQ